MERTRRPGTGKRLDHAVHGCHNIFFWNKLPKISIFQCKSDFLVGVLLRVPQNPYVLSADPCGSSTGSAIAAAANMAAVTLGTETDGSILCPASLNSVVGIKPTVGLTSRAGVIPISPRQDTVG